MRKFAANYLISNTGAFLKNGMAVAGEDGFILQYIDTNGDLIEVEQLSFHNGILMAGIKFTKINATQTISVSGKPFNSLVLKSVAELTQLSIQNLIDLCKHLQIQFPEMKIQAIMNEIYEVLLGEGGFIKETNPEIYLLTSVDLVKLHFTPKTRLKKII